MWNRAPFLNGWALAGLALLLLGGCAPKADPFGQQVQLINATGIQGEKLFSQGKLPDASRKFTRALTLSRSVDYPQGTARQLNNLGAVALEEKDYKKARALFTRAYDLNLDQQQWAAASINQANLATVAQKAGTPEEVSQHLATAQTIARLSGSAPALGRVYLQWASFCLDQGDLAAARTYLTAARRLATTPSLRGTLYHHWGRLCLARGDTRGALEMFSQALEIDRDLLDRAAMAGDLLYLGETYRTMGILTRAWDYYVRAFYVYAGMGKKSQLDVCLEKMAQVNSQGQLGHSLTNYEKLARPSPS
jgi:tetratricopeptide (TPR) repeat protein